jgi:hypothetical protein
MEVSHGEKSIETKTKRGDGALQAAAVLIRTCKRQGMEPFGYLRDVLDRIILPRYSSVGQICAATACLYLSSTPSQMIFSSFKSHSTRFPVR